MIIITIGIFGFFGLFLLGRIFIDPVDHRVSCEQLPSLESIDERVAVNMVKLEEMFVSLQACDNNQFNCPEGNCTQFDFDKRKIRDSNSILDWQVHSRCRRQKKADFIFSYTSACEIKVFSEFRDEQDYLFGVPVRYYNY